MFKTSTPLGPTVTDGFGDLDLSSIVKLINPDA
jgi:hypothetical protein